MLLLFCIGRGRHAHEVRFVIRYIIHAAESCDLLFLSHKFWGECLTTPTILSRCRVPTTHQLLIVYGMTHLGLEELLIEKLAINKLMVYEVVGLRSESAAK